MEVDIDDIGVEVWNVEQGSGAPALPTREEGREQLLLPTCLRYICTRILTDYKVQYYCPLSIFFTFSMSSLQFIRPL